MTKLRYFEQNKLYLTINPNEANQEVWHLLPEYLFQSISQL
jgi:hypothetical protein